VIQDPDFNPEIAAGGNGDMLRFIQMVMADRSLQSRGLDMGVGIVSSKQPTASTLSVVGVDGHYLATITNPADAKSPVSAQARQIAAASKSLFQAQYGPMSATMIHEVQYANDLNFNADSGLKTLGGAPSSKTSYDITAPNEKRYWRLRSRFPGSDWTDWQILQDPLICGAALVEAGALRQTSLVPNAAVGRTNFATVDSVDAGSYATIRVYGIGGAGTSWTGKVADTIEGPWPSASLAGYAYNTNYIVMMRPDQTYLVATAFSDTTSDNLRFVGNVHTVSSGGAGGTTGGGGVAGGWGGSKLPPVP